MPPKAEEKPGPSNQGDDNVSVHSYMEEEVDRTSWSEKKVQHYKKLKYIRIGILFVLWFTFTTLLMVTEEVEGDWKRLTVPVEAGGKDFLIDSQPHDESLTLNLNGPFVHRLTDLIGRDMTPQQEFLKDFHEETTFFLNVNVRRRFKTDTGQYETEPVSEPWRLMLMESSSFDELQRRNRQNVFKLKSNPPFGEYLYHFELESVNEPLPLLVQSFPGKIKTTTSIVLSTLIIIGLYTMLFWDVTSRAVVGLIFCTLSIALTGIYHTRAKLPEVVKYVNIDFLLLLIGLTVIYGIFAETGGDRYVAVQMFRLSNGHLWPMLTVLSIISAAGSAFLDQLTIMMLVTLFTLRICEIQELNPASVLTCLIIFSNIGYMLTPIGIVQFAVLSHKGVIHSEYQFKGYGPFMLQMIIPVFFGFGLTYICLRLCYRSTKSMQIIEAPIVSRLRHAIRFWDHTAKSLGDYSEIEKSVHHSVEKKVTRLRSLLRRLGKMPLPTEDFNNKLKRLQEKHTIRNKPQIIMCAAIVTLVISMQFAYFFNLHYLSHGWTCLLFSLILLALANWNDFESLMSKMDWSTVLLVTCIMIITKAISPLGLLEETGDFIVRQICSINEDQRLYLGSIILICVSAFGSAFFDTAYVCFSMAGSVVDIVHSSDSNMAMEPLILAVLLGAGFGSNVTLISAYSNIVCAGLAEKHEFKFYFWDFFKVGALVTLINLTLSIVYVMLFIVALRY